MSDRYSLPGIVSIIAYENGQVIATGDGGYIKGRHRILIRDIVFQATRDHEKDEMRVHRELAQCIGGWDYRRMVIEDVYMLAFER